MNNPLVDPTDGEDYDRRLLDHVHPVGWANPTPARRYHLVVIGGGTAGLVCAAGAAGLGARVALIESGLLGGDCLNVGCVPSKGVIRAARAWHAVSTASEFGVQQVPTDGDFAAAMARMRRLRAAIAPHDSAERFKSLGVDVFFGQGRFTEPKEIDIAGAKLRFRRAVVATGSRPVVPNLPGLTEIGYLTNETVFDLTQLPERLAVIGAGPIGCELAQAFARFGSEVTILDQGERVLPREDAEASRTLQAALERDRVRYVPHVELREVRGGEGEIRVYYKCEGRTGQIGVDQVLLAVGRRPNVEGIGLAEAEIEHGKKGIAVDDRLRTTNPRVYACGDVVARDLFTHAADAQARLVIQNALFSGRARASGLLIPRCTYTSPEVAHVGLNDETASLSGIATETLTVSLEGVDRAVLDGHPEGFLKLRVEKGGDRILGATLVAEHAGETIGELAVAIAARVGLGQLARVIHPYPTQAEIIKKAADTWRRGRLTNGVKRALSAYFWLRR